MNRLKFGDLVMTKHGKAVVVHAPHRAISVRCFLEEPIPNRRAEDFCNPWEPTFVADLDFPIAEVQRIEGDQ